MTTRSHRLLAVMAALALSPLMTAAPSAHAADAGPPLETPIATLQDAVSCPVDIANPSKTPILLVHGTFSTPAETWSWGYERALRAKGYSVCTVRLPERALIDMQISAEYVVHAIRHMNETSGRKISIIGHSQGGVLPTWALRFWPDLAERVDDYIALAGPQNGTALANSLCAPGRCPEITHQLAAHSNWITALRRHPIDGAVSFSSLASYGDEVVFPQPGAAAFPGATRVMVQDVCPGRVVGHLSMLGDAAMFALVIDALTHAGPVEASRVSRTVCWRATYDELDPAGLSALLATGVAAVTAFVTLPYTDHEPLLREYAITG